MAWLDYDEHVDSLSTKDNEVGFSSPESTTQTLSSFEEYTPPVTYLEEVEKTLGTPIEVEPLNETKLEKVGLNCNHNTHLSSMEVPSFDGPEHQPLLNSPSLDEVSPLGEELSLFDRPNEVERGRILEAHRLEPILQQQISQRMVPSHQDGMYRYYHPHFNSSVGEPPLYLLNKGKIIFDEKKLFFNSLMSRSLEVLRKFHWTILGGRFNQLSHVSSSLLGKPGEY
ncbi:hypothetical protein Tco_1111634 [Tanacetum coccineum]|uniref:Uncharacterized protein n=1 Tax=Tanacetum coccineum TaxID=301880 RepID=A0ABQ5INH2_9ASTR